MARKNKSKNKGFERPNAGELAPKRRKEYTLGTSVKPPSAGDGIGGIPANFLITLLFH